MSVVYIFKIFRQKIQNKKKTSSKRNFFSPSNYCYSNEPKTKKKFANQKIKLYYVHEHHKFTYYYTWPAGTRRRWASAGIWEAIQDHGQPAAAVATAFPPWAVCTGQSEKKYCTPTTAMVPHGRRTLIYENITIIYSREHSHLHIIEMCRTYARITIYFTIKNEKLSNHMRTAIYWSTHSA